MLASADRTVPVGPDAFSDVCSVVDLDCRHVNSDVAIERVVNLHKRPSEHRCHKMDAGLRGNWPHECLAFVELGYKVAVVPSFPDAGRRCDQGVVYIDDVPLLDSPFGSDPLSAPCSSRPVDVMEEAGCVHDDIVVWDANDNDSLRAAIERSLREERILIGPAGALGLLGQYFLPNLGNRVKSLELPVLIVCGSLNATSRKQIEILSSPVFSLEDEIQPFEEVAILKTDYVDGPIDRKTADEVGQVLAAKVHQTKHFVETYVLIGGDTVKANVKSMTLETKGTIDVGVPVSKWGDHVVVSKGGGIGHEYTLINMLDRLE